MRFWEVGPTDGQPLLIIHGYLFPFMLLNAQKYLEQNNIRLVIPIRPGYLDAHGDIEVFHDGRLVDQSIEDLVQFIQQTWHSPVPVVGHATGGFFTMMIATSYPKLFSKIVVSSINLLTPKKDKNSYSASFFGGIRQLANNMGIYETLVQQFQKTIFSNGQTTKFVLRRLFKDCQTDADVLDGKIGAGQSYDWYRHLHKHSPLGIASDFKLIISRGNSAIENVTAPIKLLHGPDDGFTAPEEVVEFLGNNKNVRLDVLPEGGHLVSASHPELFWEAVVKSLQ